MSDIDVTKLGKKHRGNIGNLRPPWKKGQSGNPKGRPPKGKLLQDQMEKFLNQPCAADKEGRTWLEIVALATLQLAIKGNAAALREVWERIDGKVKQPLEHAGPDGGPLEIDAKGILTSKLRALAGAAAREQESESN